MHYTQAPVKPRQWSFISYSRRKQIPIPKNLDEAFKELDNILSSQFKVEFKNCNINNLTWYHFGLGAWIRQNWGFWVDSHLAENLRAVYPEAGIHPDDLSRFVIKNYWEYLNKL